MKPKCKWIKKTFSQFDKKNKFNSEIISTLYLSGILWSKDYVCNFESHGQIKTKQI